MRISSTIALFVLIAMTACGGDPSTTMNAAPRSVLANAEPEPGQNDFMRYCASCHAKSGRGDSRFAEILAIPIPDLTRLAWREDGTFPKDYVRWIIDGRRDVAAHGPREMPVWGYVFRAQEDMEDGPSSAAPEKDADMRIDDLVNFVEALQRLEEKI